jgi:hypothetical protein
MHAVRSSSGVFSLQPEPTPPLAVRYLLGWASQPYGLNATVASMFPGLK